MKTSKKYLGKTNVSMFLITLSTLFSVVPMICILNITSHHINGDLSQKVLLVNGSLGFFSIILRAISYKYFVKQSHDNAYSSLISIRKDLIKHMKTLPVAFFKRRKIGDLSNVISHEVEKIEAYLAHGLPMVLVSIMMPIMSVIVIGLIDFRMVLALVVSTPLALMGMTIASKFWLKDMAAVQGKHVKLSESIMEYLNGITVIKAFAKEESKTYELLGRLEEYLNFIVGSTGNIMIPMALIQFVSQLGMIMALSVGSYLVTINAISVPELIITIFLSSTYNDLFGKLEMLQHTMNSFKTTTVSLDSVFMEKSNLHSAYTPVTEGDIKLENVSFAYEEEKVLDQINLVFKNGSTNAIIGSSGSGKSTILNLLMGYYKTNQGKITIGGKDYKELDEKALSRIMTVVQQDAFLFNISIADNIRLGKENATMEEIIQAAKKAQIHDTIQSLPNGYDSLAGEGGVLLSGGERQRVSIARMILKDAPIILLDEATAAIDPYNEHLIKKAIENLSIDKTVIMIAHHLSTIIHADQIVLMKEGKVEDLGSHEHLLINSTLYRHMIEIQAEVDKWQIKEAV